MTKNSFVAEVTFNTYSNNLILENHILLLFKIYLYNSRNQKKVILGKLIWKIIKLKDIEKGSAGNDDENIMLYNKWQNKNVLLFLKKTTTSC